MGKIHVKNFHLPNLAILYIKRFVSASSIEVPKAPTRENVRQKSYWGYNVIFRGHGTPCLGPSPNETRTSKPALSMISHRIGPVQLENTKDAPYEHFPDLLKNVQNRFFHRRGSPIP